MKSTVKLLNSIKNDGARWCLPSKVWYRWRNFVFLWQKERKMTQKEAIIEALNRLGGKAALKDIYRFAYSLADFSGSKDWKATIRWYLQKETDSFRSTKRGWWELVSFQEDIAVRDKRIKELEVEVETLRKIPKEDDFVRRLVRETKILYKHETDKIEVIRQILYKVGRSDAEEELDAWIEGKEYKPSLNVTGDYVVNKNVDNEVHGVSSGATGININNDKDK